MSFVIAAPELVTAAATDLANVGSSLGSANAAAALPTTEILAAAEDEVSAAIASVFPPMVRGFRHSVRRRRRFMSSLCRR
jgi:PE family